MAPAQGDLPPPPAGLVTLVVSVRPLAALEREHQINPMA
jgi:hypothetical protein